MNWDSPGGRNQLPHKSVENRFVLPKNPILQQKDLHLIPKQNPKHNPPSMKWKSEISLIHSTLNPDNPETTRPNLFPSRLHVSWSNGNLNQGGKPDIHGSVIIPIHSRHSIGCLGRTLGKDGSTETEAVSKHIPRGRRDGY